MLVVGGKPGWTEGRKEWPRGGSRGENRVGRTGRLKLGGEWEGEGRRKQTENAIGMRKTVLNMLLNNIFVILLFIRATPGTPASII